MSGDGEAANAGKTKAETADMALAQADPEALAAEVARASDLVAGFQAERDKLVEGMAKLGYPADAGPEDATPVDRALLAIAGMHQQAQADATEMAGLREQLAKAKRAKASVREAPRSAKLRDAVRMDNPKADALLEALLGKSHLLVFSDGEREIAALGAVVVTGTAWARRGGRVILREPVRVKPNVPVELAGFALFDGTKQIGWCDMAAPLRIAGGQEIKLDGQVLF